MTGFLQDVRYAVRHARTAPALGCAVIVTLALAIGANTALFSLVNALLLRPLPVRDPDELVLLQATDDRGQQNRPIFYSTFSTLAKLPVFETLTLYSGGGLFQIEVRGGLKEGLIEASTPGLFESLGLQPHLGRFFSSNDSPADGPSAPVVVLSYDFWQRAFGGDPKALGETILISGTPATVIGITPREYKGFYVEAGLGFSVPLSFLNRQMSTDSTRPVRGLNAIGRLARGVSLEQARAAVDAAWPAIRVETVPSGLSPAEQKAILTQRMKVDSLATGFSQLRLQYREALVLLPGITVLLLIVGCINVSGLLLVRAVDRKRHVAIHFALGASPGQVARQLLVESILLSSTGAVLAVPIAWWTTKVVGGLLWQGAAWDRTPPVLSVTPDARVLATTAAIGVVTGIVVGMLPAWTVARSRPLADLRSDRTVAHSKTRWANTPLVAQVAMTLMLVVGAGLFASSLSKLRQIDTGVQTDGLRFSRLFAVPNGYRNQNDAVYYPELAQQLAAVPGVQSVALATDFPTAFGLGDRIRTQTVSRSGDTSPANAAEALIENVTPQFFETAGIVILNGRDFTWQDDLDYPPVAIINVTVARTLFADENPVGRHIRIGTDPKRSAVEVVAVAADAAMGSFKRPHMPVVFRPRMQELALARAPVMVFRTTGNPLAVENAMEKVILGMGHEYARRFSSVEEQIDVTLVRERLLAISSSLFAGLAVLLAFVGLYAAFTHSVARRTREIGVRVALGSTRIGVVAMVVRQSLWVTLFGLAIGVPCALGAGRLIRSLLFDVDPSNSATLVAATVFVVAIGIAASLRPALRASGVDPTTVLRTD